MDEATPLLVSEAMNHPPSSDYEANALLGGTAISNNTVKAKVGGFFMGCARNWRTIVGGVIILTALMMLADMNTKMTYILLGGPPSPTFSEMTSEMSKHPSFINIFTDPGDHSVFALDIPNSYLKDPKPVVFSAIFYRGSNIDDARDIDVDTYLYMPAENTDETVYEFRLTDDMKGVDLIRKTMSLRSTDPTMQQVTEQSTWEGWEVTMPIVAMDVDTDGDTHFLVDASELVVNGFYVTDIGPDVLAGEPRLLLSECKSFPRNFDVVAQYKIMPPPARVAASGSKEPLDVALMFSVALLPEEPMMARVWDERVGYFTANYIDLGDHREDVLENHASSMVDRNVKIIERRRLEEDGQILYYIDPTVPEKWREAMKAGVEAWQPAFKELGYGDAAIRAILPGDEDWPKDYDVGDIRYNTISWAIDLDATFALGPSTVDPRSGEILKSNIVFTNGWLKAWLSVFEKMGPNPTGEPNDRRHLHDDGDHDHNHEEEEHVPVFHADHDPHRRLTSSDHDHALFVHDDHDHDHDHDHEDFSDFEYFWKPKANGEPRAHPLAFLSRGTKSVRHHNWRGCRSMHLENPSLHLARMALALSDDESVADDIIAQGWMNVAMHEVGHTLGLRHNFKGSTHANLNQLGDVEFTQAEGLTSSVMDYLPINIVGKRDFGAEHLNLDFFTPVIGKYDFWAIEYGYKMLDDEQTARPHPVLEETASVNLPFSTDEDGSRYEGADPLNAAYDLSDDPVEYYSDGILHLVRKLRPTLLDRAVFVGEPFYQYSNNERGLLTQVRFAGLYLAKFVGGFKIDRQRRQTVEDSNGRLDVYNTERQRSALGFIMDILSEDPNEMENGESLYPASDSMQYLLKREGMCEGLMQYCQGIVPYEVLSSIDTLQSQVLTNLFDPERLNRVRMQEWYAQQSGDNVVTLKELFQTTTNTIWGADLAQSSRVQKSRNWNLQTYWVDLLIYAQCVPDLPGDISSHMAGQLYQLKSSIESVVNSTKTADIASNDAYPQLVSVMHKIQLWEKGDMCESMMLMEGLSQS